MWRLSPFPRDADRPLRGVLVYASHAIEQHLKSWSFWLMLAMMGLMMGAPCLTSALVVPARMATEAPPAVVADPALVSAVEEAAGPASRWEILDAPPEDPERTVLTLSGTSVAGMQAHLRATHEVDREERRAWRLIHRMRRDALVPDEMLDRLRRSDPEEDQARLEEVTSLIGPLAVGLFLFLGLVSGAGAAAELSRSRDEEYFNVLRLGTPVSVIFLGGLIERALLTLIWVMPLAAMAVATLGVASISQLLLRPEEAFRHLVAMPALAVWGGLTAFAICAGLGAILGTLTRGNRTLRATGQIAPIFAMMLAPLGFRALLDPSPDPSGWLFLPAIGVAFAASGLNAGLGWLWVAASALVQGAWGLAGLRVGTWAFEVEDPPLEVLRRLWSLR